MKHQCNYSRVDKKDTTGQFRIGERRARIGKRGGRRAGAGKREYKIRNRKTGKKSSITATKVAVAVAKAT